MTTIEPPQPPQKQALPFGTRWATSVVGSAKPIADLDGTASTLSTPFACSWNIKSTVEGKSSCTPLAMPPSEIADTARGSDRALPWPLQAPMSARRHETEFAATASGIGAVKVLRLGSV